MSGVHTFWVFSPHFATWNVGPKHSVTRCPTTIEKYPIFFFATKSKLGQSDFHLPVVSAKILIISSGWWQAQAQKFLNKRLRQIHTVNHLWHMYSSTVFKAIYVLVFMYTVIIWLLFWKNYVNLFQNPQIKCYSQPSTPITLPKIP